MYTYTNIRFNGLNIENLVFVLFFKLDIDWKWLANDLFSLFYPAPQFFVVFFFKSGFKEIRWHFSDSEGKSKCCIQSILLHCSTCFLNIHPAYLESGCGGSRLGYFRHPFSQQHFPAPTGGPPGITGPDGMYCTSSKFWVCPGRSSQLVLPIHLQSFA